MELINPSLYPDLTEPDPYNQLNYGDQGTMVRNEQENAYRKHILAGLMPIDPEAKQRAVAATQMVDPNKPVFTEEEYQGILARLAEMRTPADKRPEAMDQPSVGYQTAQGVRDGILQLLPFADAEVASPLEKAPRPDMLEKTLGKHLGKPGEMAGKAIQGFGNLATGLITDVAEFAAGTMAGAPAGPLAPVVGGVASAIGRGREIEEDKRIAYQREVAQLQQDAPYWMPKLQAAQAAAPKEDWDAGDVVETVATGGINALTFGAGQKAISGAMDVIKNIPTPYKQEVVNKIIRSEIGKAALRTLGYDTVGAAGETLIGQANQINFDPTDPESRKQMGDFFMSGEFGDQMAYETAVNLLASGHGTLRQDMPQAVREAQGGIRHRRDLEAKEAATGTAKSKLSEIINQAMGRRNQAEEIAPEDADMDAAMEAAMQPEPPKAPGRPAQQQPEQPTVEAEVITPQEQRAQDIAEEIQATPGSVETKIEIDTPQGKRVITPAKRVEAEVVSAEPAAKIEEADQVTDQVTDQSAQEQTNEDVAGEQVASAVGGAERVLEAGDDQPQIIDGPDAVERAGPLPQEPQPDSQKAVRLTKAQRREARRAARAEKADRVDQDQAQPVEAQEPAVATVAEEPPAKSETEPSPTHMGKVLEAKEALRNIGRTKPVKENSVKSVVGVFYKNPDGTKRVMSRIEALKEPDNSGVVYITEDGVRHKTVDDADRHAIKSIVIPKLREEGIVAPKKDVPKAQPKGEAQAQAYGTTEKTQKTDSKQVAKSEDSSPQELPEASSAPAPAKGKAKGKVKADPVVAKEQRRDEQKAKAKERVEEKKREKAEARKPAKSEDEVLAGLDPEVRAKLFKTDTPARTPIQGSDGRLEWDPPEADGSMRMYRIDEDGTRSPFASIKASGDGFVLGGKLEGKPMPKNEAVRMAEQKARQLLVKAGPQKGKGKAKGKNPDPAPATMEMKAEQKAETQYFTEPPEEAKPKGKAKAKPAESLKLKKVRTVKEFNEKLRARIGKKWTDGHAFAIEALITANAKYLGITPDQWVQRNIVDVGDGTDLSDHALYQIDDVYHGTAYLFDKFLLKAVGTGEGAQYFGHGLYFTEVTGIAKDYANNTAIDRLEGVRELYDHIGTIANEVGSKDRQLFARNRTTNTITLNDSSTMRSTAEEVEFLIETKVEALRDFGEKFPQHSDAMNRLADRLDDLIEEYVSDLKVLATESDKAVADGSGLALFDNPESGRIEHKSQDLVEAYQDFYETEYLLMKTMRDAAEGILKGKRIIYKNTLFKGQEQGADYTILDWREEVPEQFKDDILDSFESYLVNDFEPAPGVTLDDITQAVEQLEMAFNDTDPVTGDPITFGGVYMEMTDIIARLSNDAEAYLEALERRDSNPDPQDGEAQFWKEMRFPYQHHVSEVLYRTDIKGLKYRAHGGKIGAFNYVVFKDSDINIEETTFFQRDANGKIKGAIDIMEDGRAVIHALKGADISTVAHELAHQFRRLLKPDELTAVEKALGVKDGKWTRDPEERFARMFERYLREGKAPTKALDKVFKAMREWLKQIYRKIKGSPLAEDIHPDVKRVFEKMLGKEQAPPSSPRRKVDSAPEGKAKPSDDDIDDIEPPSGEPGKNPITGEDVPPLDSVAIYDLITAMSAHIKLLKGKDLAALPKAAMAYMKPLADFVSGNPGVEIGIRADIMRKGKGAAFWNQLLAHEFGHLADLYPAMVKEAEAKGVEPWTDKRGNVLGHVYALRNYMLENHKDALAKDSELRKELIAWSEDLNPYIKDKAPKDYVQKRESATELVAEAMTGILLRPKEFSEMAPKFWREWHNALKNRPEVKVAYEAMVKDMKKQAEELAYDRAGRLINDFQKGKQILREQVIKAEEAKKQRETTGTENFLDMFQLASQWTQEAKHSKIGGLIEPELNARERIERMMRDQSVHDVNRTAHEMFQKLGEAYGNSKADLERAQGDLDALLFFERVGADRSELANAYNYQPDTAAKDLEGHLKNIGPEKAAAIKAAAKILRDLGEDTLRRAHEAGMISDDNYKEWTKDGQHRKYAPFKPLDFLNLFETPTFRHAQEGSFRAISSPSTQYLLRMMGQRPAIAEQIAKKTTIDLGIALGKDEVRRLSKGQEPKPYMGKMSVHEDGKLVSYEIDPVLARAFSEYNKPYAQDNKALNFIRGANRFQKATFLTYSISFALRQMVRDIERNWANMPKQAQKGFAKDLFRVMRETAASASEAWGYTKGEYSETVDWLMDNAVIEHNGHGFYVGKDDTTPKDELLIKLGLKDKKDPGRVARILEGPVVRHIKRLSEASEVLPKIAMKKIMADSGLTEMEMSHYLRNHVGTPNYSAKGFVTPLTNTLAQFSNIQLQFIRSEIEMLREQADFKRKAVVAGRRAATHTLGLAVFPAMLYALAEGGGFGEEIKEIYEKIPSYDKANYLCIPTFMWREAKDGGRVPIYFRIPREERARLTQGLTYSLLTRWSDVDGIKDVPSAWLDTWGNMMTYTLGQLPSLTSNLEVLGNVINIMNGGPGWDDFKQREIIDQTERGAGGGVVAVETMKYATEQLGLKSLDPSNAVGTFLKNVGIWWGKPDRTPTPERIRRQVSRAQQESDKQTLRGRDVLKEALDSNDPGIIDRELKKGTITKNQAARYKKQLDLSPRERYLMNQGIAKKDWEKYKD